MLYYLLFFNSKIPIQQYKAKIFWYASMLRVAFPYLNKVNSVGSCFFLLMEITYQEAKACNS